MTQAQLAALVRVSQAAIAQLEAGSAAQGLIMDCAGALGITLDHVIEWVPWAN